MGVQSRILVKSRCRCCKKIVQNGDQTSKEPGRAWLLKDEADSRRRTSPHKALFARNGTAGSAIRVKWTLHASRLWRRPRAPVAQTMV